MKTQNLDTERPSSWRWLKQRPENDQNDPSDGAKSEAPPRPEAINRSGHRLGWIERTLLAVDNDRVFIGVSDPELRGELVATYEDQGCNVIAASSSHTLLAFLEQLPVPRDPWGDVVIAEDDLPGTKVTELRRQLRARGWRIPVFTVSTESPSGKARAAS